MNLEEMKNIDIYTVDKDSLVDISDVEIDMSKPREERIARFVKDIKNPYCFKCGETVVRVAFSNSGRTLEDGLVQYLKGKII